jgi:hypothetical protein
VGRAPREAGAPGFVANVSGTARALDLFSYAGDLEPAGVKHPSTVADLFKVSKKLG